jgi:hypothetical protein
MKQELLKLMEQFLEETKESRKQSDPYNIGIFPDPTFSDFIDWLK